jgi:hypothetical protein
VSEYQYYEFRAIDQALTESEMAALRDISTRAVITSSSFVNHYEWGDLKADPLELLEKYFDAFIYFANWGTRRLWFRLRKSRLATNNSRLSCRRPSRARDELESM